MLKREYLSPCGPLLLGVSGEKICLCDWMIPSRIEKTLKRMKKYFSEAFWQNDNEAMLDMAVRELDEYFAGKREEFDLPVTLWGTAFQQRVLKALTLVPFGRTKSYSEIATSIGRPSAVRAVANSIGANPLSLFIPCHRILGLDGSLSGYAGTIPAKLFLLSLERQTADSHGTSGPIKDSCK